MKTENELKTSSLAGNGLMIMLSGVCCPQCEVWGPGGTKGVWDASPWAGGEDEFHNQGEKSCLIHQDAFLASMT